MNKEELSEKATSATYRPKRKKRKSVPEDTHTPSKAGRKTLQVLTEDLAVPLADEEMRETAATLAAQLSELSNHTAHAKEVKANLKAREAEILSSMEALGLRYRSGTKLSPVQVRAEADFATGVVEYVRVDSGKVIRTRPLRPEERQETFVTGDGSTVVPPPYQAGAYADEHEAEKLAAAGDLDGPEELPTYSELALPEGAASLDDEPEADGGDDLSDDEEDEDGEV